MKTSLSNFYIVNLIINIIKKGAFKGQNLSQKFSDRFGGNLIDHIIKKFRSVLEDESQQLFNVITRIDIPEYLSRLLAENSACDFSEITSASQVDFFGIKNTEKLVHIY